MNKTERLRQARAAKGPKRKLRKEKPKPETFTLSGPSHVVDADGKFLYQVSRHSMTIS